MTLITNEEIQILNSARRTLKDIYSRAEGAHADVDDNVYSKGSWYRNRGRLVEQAHGAESAIFRTLNIAKSYCDQDISDWQMHLRDVPVDVYAEQLVRLVTYRRHRRIPSDSSKCPIMDGPTRRLRCQRVPDRCRPSIFGIAFDNSDEHDQFCNEAIAIAEMALFGEEES